MEWLFLLAFTLHNIEEGIWLPKWSKHAKKYYSPVSNREFHFADRLFECSIWISLWSPVYERLHKKILVGFSKLHEGGLFSMQEKQVDI